MSYPKGKAKGPRSLKDWRASKGLTIREAAAATGYSAPGYHKLESGHRHPQTPEQLRRLMKVTGVALEVLAGVA